MRPPNRANTVIDEEPGKSGPNPEKASSGFADSVLMLAGGTTIAMAIPVVAAPITSRLFGPDAYGLASLFLSGATLLGLAACLRYEIAIALPKRDEDAAALFSLCWIMLAITTSLTAVATFTFGAKILGYLDATELSRFLWLFPVCVFCEGARLPLYYWHMRRKRFHIPAAGRVVNGISTSIAEIAGGFAGFRMGGNLIALRIIGLMLFPISLFVPLSKTDLLEIRHHTDRRTLFACARRYLKFPLLDTWAILVTQFSWYVPTLLLTAFFGPVVTGLYSKAIYLFMVPIAVIAQSVDQVFLQKSAESRATGKDIAGLVEAVFNRMVTISVLPFMILMMVGPEVFQFFLGANWTESGVYAQILAPWLFVTFLALSIRTLFSTLERQELDLASNSLLLVLRIIGLAVGGLLLHNARMTLFIFMILGIPITLSRIFILMREVHLSPARVQTHFAGCCIHALPSLFLIGAAKWWLRLGPAYVVALSLLFSLPYVFLALRKDVELRVFFAKSISRIYSRSLTISSRRA